MIFELRPEVGVGHEKGGDRHLLGSWNSMEKGLEVGKRSVSYGIERRPVT